jgi:glycyl-tRNA synthetase
VPDAWSYEQQRKFFDLYDMKCPNCKAKDWTDIRQFNLMFKTHQ